MTPVPHSKPEGVACERPVLLLGVEHVGHGHRQGIVQVRVARPENVLDGAEHAQGGVVLGNQGLMLDVGAGDKGDAAVCIHMVATVLRIVFDHKD